MRVAGFDEPLSRNACRTACKFQIIAHARQIRFNPQSLGELGDRFGESSRLIKHSAKRIMGLGMIGVVSQNDFELSDRIGAPAGGNEQQAEIIVRIGVIGPKPYSLLKMCKSILGPFQRFEDQSQFVMRSRVIRVEAQKLFIT